MQGAGRLAPVQKHERERGMFLRLHHEIPGVRIGVENGFGKSGKQRIEDQASKNKPGSIAPGFVVERSVERAVSGITSGGRLSKGASAARASAGRRGFRASI